MIFLLFKIIIIIIKMIEIKTYYISDTHERAIVIDDELAFKGEDRVYKKGKGLIKTPVYYFEQGLDHALSLTGLNFLHGEVIHTTNEEFNELLK